MHSGTKSERIPLVDLGFQHRAIAEEVRAGFDAVMTRTSFIGGPDVEAFEEAFARYCMARHCVGVANGTDAIELLIRAHGLGAGDEVIVPANTFVATVEAVVRAGATPVLADVDPVHLLLDPESVRRVIGPRTAAVVAVHLYGQMAPMEALRALAAERGVLLLEDAAQAHGATQNGRRAGGLADGAAFSFYPGKNLGAYGDAGAVMTNDHDVARRLRQLRDHGSVSRYEHVVPGMNSRLDALQAVVLSAKLRLLDEWNDARRAAADIYASALAGSNDIVLPRVAGGNEHAWHLYVVRVAERDRMRERLIAESIDAGIHYPRPVHRQPAFAHLGAGRDDLQVSELAAQSILSLPMYPGMTPEQQERVADAIFGAMRDAA